MNEADPTYWGIWVLAARGRFAGISEVGVMQLPYALLVATITALVYLWI